VNVNDERGFATERDTRLTDRIAPWVHYIPIQLVSIAFGVLSGPSNFTFSGLLGPL
jgi:hypothetical protein